MTPEALYMVAAMVCNGGECYWQDQPQDGTITLGGTPPPQIFIGCGADLQGYFSVRDATGKLLFEVEKGARITKNCPPEPTGDVAPLSDGEEDKDDDDFIIRQSNP